MLKTILNPTIATTQRQTHRLALPAMCPVSGNPQPGSRVRIVYTPGDWVLEVYSLAGYIAEFVGGDPSGVRDMEATIQKIAADCAAVLGVPVADYYPAGLLVMEPPRWIEGVGLAWMVR